MYVCVSIYVYIYVYVYVYVHVHVHVNHCEGIHLKKCNLYIYNLLQI